MPHSYVSLKYHIVFSTKFRLPWITTDLESRLYEYMGGVLREKRGKLIKIGGVEDHVHILAGLSQSLAVADVVGSVKANSSSFGKETGDNPDFSWQPGYAAFTVSESQVPKVRRYIQRQKIHHRKVSYEDEVRELARHHGIVLEDSFFATAETPSDPGTNP